MYLLIKIIGLEYVERVICDQTYENHNELFNQVTWIESLESIINEISSQIQVYILCTIFGLYCSHKLE